MTNPIPLSGWLRCLGHQAASSIVAVKGDQRLSAQALMTQVDVWLTIIDQYPGQRWAVYHTDSAEFLAIVLALWQRGKTACVPGDNQPGTVARLCHQVQQFAGCFYSDENTSKVRCFMAPAPLNWQPETALDLSEQTSSLKAENRWQIAERHYPALEIYTSGSTGEPKAICKTLAQLELEIELLGQQWPQLSQEAANTLVLSTVSHQHFYGLIFRLLLPLTNGQWLDSEICEYPEDIFYRAQQQPDLPFQLISSPSHLSRLPDALPWHQLADRCLGITSAAAPLQRKDSVSVQQQLASLVREIYGSSETGVVAWRCQALEGDEDALWQALPGIQVQPDHSGCLQLCSPYADDTDWYALPDRVEFIGQGFKLLGRMDRIVKIEGKRVSLTALETQVQNSPWVAQSRALALEKKRVESAIVIELNDEGWRHYHQQGKKWLVKQLKSELQGHFETVMLPRRWRFVEQLPYNAQGKITQQQLELLFQTNTEQANAVSRNIPSQADVSKQQPGQTSSNPMTSNHSETTLINGQPATQDKWPADVRVVNQQSIQSASSDTKASDDDTFSLELRCRIPAELIYFDGHFDSSPILPGIVQVHWAEAFGRHYFPIQGRFIRLEQVKFQQVIKPEAEITIKLSYQRKNNKLSFSYDSAQGGHSSGRICFT